MAGPRALLLLLLVGWGEARSGGRASSVDPCRGDLHQGSGDPHQGRGDPHQGRGNPHHLCPRVSTRLLSRQELRAVLGGERTFTAIHRGRGGRPGWVEAIVRAGRSGRKRRRRRQRRSQARTVARVRGAGGGARGAASCHKYAVFKVFRTDFTLCLLLGTFLTDPILARAQNLQVAVYGAGSTFRSRGLAEMRLRVAEGHVLGQVHSSVRGFVWRDKFYGTVVTARDTLHIEPLLHLGPVGVLSTGSRPVNAYVYRVFSRASQRRIQEGRRSRAFQLYRAGRWAQLRKHYRKFYEKFKLLSVKRSSWGRSRSRRRREGRRRRRRRKEAVRRRRRREEGRAQCRSCSLLLVADTSFFNEVGQGNVRQAVLQMLYHVREANLLLRRQDFDGDGEADCVGVHVAGVGVVTAESSVDNLLGGEFRSPERYLRTFSRYQLDGYCLALLFSSRTFPGKVLGLSWRGDERRKGGICQTRSPAPPWRHTAGGRRELLNLNSLFITLRTRRTARIPLRMGVLNLAHELLHSFGASHDPATSDCSARDEARHGRFLMSRFSSSGVKRNNERVSNCTAAAVSLGLASPGLSHCLETVPAGQCGDGRVDRWAGEECDCGSPESCLASRSACVPPGLRRGELECRAYRPRPQAVPRARECSRLGLATCTCRPGANAVTAGCGACCRAKGAACRPAEEWTETLFRDMRRHLARVCWHGGTVKDCIATSAKWSSTLASLSLYRPDSSGRVYCLRTQADSNCWQLDVPCHNSSLSSLSSHLSPSHSSLSHHATSRSSQSSHLKRAFHWAG